jgi:hypothetical protein
VTKFSVSPTLAIWLNIAYIALSGLSIPVLNSLGFTTNAPVILAWSSMVGLILNAIMHGFSSSTPGPLAPPDSPAVQAATAKQDFLQTPPKGP